MMEGLNQYSTKELVDELKGRSDVVGLEDAEWLRPTRGRGYRSEARKLLETLEVGDVKRLYHYDISCYKRKDGLGGWQCHLGHARDQLKKRSGMDFRIYHEDDHVAIVARIS